MTEWLAVGVIFVGYLLLEFLLHLARKREKRNRFRSRHTLTEDQFYCRFYADSGIPRESVSRALELVTEALEVPAGKLRPSDQFEGELGPSTLLDETLSELSHETAWSVDCPDAILWSSVLTLDDYIREVGPRLRHRRSAGRG